MAPELQGFDPYHKWLGIPPQEQPPTHYRLLGIRAFESDPDVIEAAAEQRMVHLRQRQSGPYAAFSQRLLNEVAAARLSLLVPEKKQLYDQQLQKLMSARNSVIPVAQAIPQAIPAAPVDPPFVPGLHAPVVVTGRKPLSRRRSNSLGPLLLFGSILALGGLVAGVIWWPRIQRDLVKNAQPPDEQKSGKVAAVARPEREDASNRTSARQRDSNQAGSEPDDNRPVVKAPSAEKPQATARAPKTSAPKKPEPKAARPKEPLAEAVTESEHIPEEERSAIREQRLPVPSAEDLAKAQSTVKSLYKEDFAAAKGSQQKSRLAARLLKEGQALEGDSTGRYALFEAARELSEAAGDPHTALRACDELARYDIETFELKRQSLEQCSKQAKKPNDWKQLTSAAVQVLEQAVAEDNYRAAQELLASAQTFSRKARDRELSAQLEAASARLVAAASAYEAAKEALEKVKTDASDGESHLVAGKYLAFFKGDWAQGIQHFTQSSDSSLKKLAELERGRSLDPASWLAIAEAWDQQATDADETDRRHYQLRAAYWYRQALPSLIGLQRARVQEKIKELPGGEKETLASESPRRPAAQWAALAGSWQVAYSNGAERTYEIDALGNVAFENGRQRGSFEMRGDDIILDFGDGKLERWGPTNSGLVIEHYDDARMYPGRAAISGRAVRIASAPKKSTRR